MSQQLAKYFITRILSRCSCVHHVSFFVCMCIMSSCVCPYVSCLLVSVPVHHISVCAVVSLLFMYKCIMSPCMCFCIRSPCVCACGTCLLKHMPVYHVSLSVRLCIMSLMSQPRLFKQYTRMIVSQSIWDMLNTKFNVSKPAQRFSFFKSKFKLSQQSGYRVIL